MPNDYDTSEEGYYERNYGEFKDLVIGDCPLLYYIFDKWSKKMTVERDDETNEFLLRREIEIPSDKMTFSEVKDKFPYCEILVKSSNWNFHKYLVTQKLKFSESWDILNTEIKEEFETEADKMARLHKLAVKKHKPWAYKWKTIWPNLEDK